jgi:hypothetical protein
VLYFSAPMQMRTSAFVCLRHEVLVTIVAVLSHRCLVGTSARSQVLSNEVAFFMTQTAKRTLLNHILHVALLSGCVAPLGCASEPAENDAVDDNVSTQPSTPNAGGGGSNDGSEPVSTEPASTEPASTEPNTPMGEAGAGAGGEANGGAGSSSETGGGGAGVEPEPNSEPGAVGEVCAREERVGSFRLYLGEDRTIFSGAVSNGVAPGALSRVIAAEGSCELLGPPSLLCSTPCGSGMTCAGDDNCVPSPMKVSAGAIGVSGLLAPLDVNPNGITLDYSSTIFDPFPAFETGAAIELSAEGEEVGAFTLNASGVSAMVSPDSVISVASGSGALFTWDASTANPSQANVFISFTVNAHGSVTGWIECTAEDTGSFEIPAGLVTQLIELGLSGFPRARLGRRSTDTAAVEAGCVDLSVSSEVTINLEVDGLTSCNADTDCPEGETCSPDLACRP